MNKKVLKAFSTFMFLGFLVGCSNSTSSTSSESKNSSTSTKNSVISSSSTSTIVKREFKDMLEDISSGNITYHSDYFIYYYTNENSDEIIELQRFDVYAKIEEDVYDLVAYEYDTENIASYAHLEKDEDGYVVHNDININNALVTTRVKDGEGNEFLWEESVYFNMIQYLDANDFEKVNDEKYVYRNDLKELPLNIIHTAIPTSYFDIESFFVTVKDDKIQEFIFQEIESDEVYEDCMYGRTLTITFEDIDCTEIERVKPYEEKEENEALGKALESIRTKTNYTINSIGLLEDGTTKPLKETYITEKDIYQVQYSVEGEYQTGIHTYNDELYFFESIDKYLVGTKADENTTIKQFIPKFYFSQHVFKYLGEEDGYKVYSPYSSMSAVLNYIDVLSEYEADYYSPAGKIKFYVLDNELSHIEFPVFLYDTADYRAVTNRVSYLNINETEISSATWDSFVLELPGNEASMWSDPSFDFMFEFDINYVEYMNLGYIFEKCLGSANEVPYFLTSNSNFSVSGNFSNSDGAVYITLTSLKGVDHEVLDVFNQKYEELGAKHTTFKDELMSVSSYKTDKYVVEAIIIEIENYMEISFTLPIGDLLK